MTFLNHVHMGNYNELLQLMPVDPDITKTCSYRYKYGCWRQLRPGAHRRHRLLQPAGLERRPLRVVGLYRDRPDGKRRLCHGRAPLVPAIRPDRPGWGPQWNIRSASRLPGRRGRGLHHRRRPAEVWSGIDSGDILRLAGIDRNRGNDRLPGNRQPRVQHPVRPRRGRLDTRALGPLITRDTSPKGESARAVQELILPRGTTTGFRLGTAFTLSPSYPGKEVGQAPA